MVLEGTPSPCPGRRVQSPRAGVVAAQRVLQPSQRRRWLGGREALDELGEALDRDGRGCASAPEPIRGHSQINDGDALSFQGEPNRPGHVGGLVDPCRARLRLLTPRGNRTPASDHGERGLVVVKPRPRR